MLASPVLRTVVPTPPNPTGTVFKKTQANRVSAMDSEMWPCGDTDSAEIIRVQGTDTCEGDSARPHDGSQEEGSDSRTDPTGDTARVLALARAFHFSLLRQALAL